MPQTWDWKMLRMQSAQAWIFGLYCCWLSGKHQFVHKKKAPYALPVSHHDGEDTLRHRPTQGWTVDEAGLLCKVIYLLRPSSLGLDGGGMLHTHPRRRNEVCTWGIFYPLANIVGLAKSVFPIPLRPYQQTRRTMMSCHRQGYFSEAVQCPAIPRSPKNHSLQANRITKSVS